VRRGNSYVHCVSSRFLFVTHKILATGFIASSRIVQL
jgi:hypothetical protein